MRKATQEPWVLYGVVAALVTLAGGIAATGAITALNDATSMDAGTVQFYGMLFSLRYPVAYGLAGFGAGLASRRWYLGFLPAGVALLQLPFAVVPLFGVVVLVGVALASVVSVIGGGLGAATRLAYDRRGEVRAIDIGLRVVVFGTLALSLAMVLAWAPGLFSNGRGDWRSITYRGRSYERVSLGPLKDAPSPGDDTYRGFLTLVAGSGPATLCDVVAPGAPKGDTLYIRFPWARHAVYRAAEEH